jgi:hypothetical protein
MLSHIISSDKGSGLRMEHFAVTHLRGVSKRKKVLYVLSPSNPTKNL